MTFAIWSHNKFEPNIIPKTPKWIKPTIRFTTERQKIQTLPFFDVLVDRIKIIIQTSVYRKQDHTGHNTYTTLPITHRVPSKEQSRATAISTNKESLKKEESISRATLLRNGYPPKFINKVLSKSQNQKEPHQPGNQKRWHGSTAYPGDIEKICRIRKIFGMLTAVRSQTMLCSIPTETKPKNKIQKTKNCIYNIPHKCKKKYTGETERPLNTRITKHKCNTKMGEISKSKKAEVLG
jgi:hypothetical protein